MKWIFSLFLVLLSVDATSQVSQSRLDDAIEEIHKILDKQRESLSLPPFQTDPVLANAAIIHARYMDKIEEVRHDEKSTKFSTPEERVKAFKGQYQRVEEIAFSVESKDLAFHYREMMDMIREQLAKRVPIDSELLKKPFDHSSVSLISGSRPDVVYCVILFAVK